MSELAKAEATLSIHAPAAPPHQLAAHLKKLAACVARTSPDQWGRLFAEFHSVAGCLADISDVDFGALVLEVEAATQTDPNVKLRLLEEAEHRAWLLTSGATAGGEAISRARHLNRISSAIQRLKPNV